MVHCQNSDQYRCNRVLPGVVLLVCLRATKRHKWRGAGAGGVSPPQTATMMLRCSVGLVSLSATPRTSVISPVSVSNRKRPLSSPEVWTYRHSFYAGSWVQSVPSTILAAVGRTCEDDIADGRPQTSVSIYCPNGTWGEVQHNILQRYTHLLLSICAETYTFIVPTELSGI